MKISEINKIIDDKKYQVFLFSSPSSLPISFATHSWFVLNERGKISRWELYVLNRQKKSWGKVHKDFLPNFSGLPILPYPFLPQITFTPGFCGYIEGSEAQKMCEFIVKSAETYPARFRSKLLGPNSNAYIQWVLDHFPEADMKLPWNAIGKGYWSKSGK